MSGPTKVQPATPAEVAFFADPERKVLHEFSLRLMKMWESEVDPKNVYFLPVELETDENGQVERKFYMETPREDEPWLSGIIIAFRTLEEMESYLDLLSETKNIPREMYDIWEANLDLIHETFDDIDQQWKKLGEAGIRVELCKVSEHGSIEYVDDLFDQTTT